MDATNGARTRHSFRTPVRTARPAARTVIPPPLERSCTCGGRCGYGFARPADEHVYGKPVCLQD